MSPEKFDEIQRNLWLFGGLIADWDLAEFIQACEHAGAFGVFADPTLWREKHEDVERVQKLAEALLPFWRKVRPMKQEALRKAGMPAEEGR